MASILATIVNMAKTDLLGNLGGLTSGGVSTNSWPCVVDPTTLAGTGTPQKLTGLTQENVVPPSEGPVVPGGPIAPGPLTVRGVGMAAPVAGADYFGGVGPFLGAPAGSVIYFGVPTGGGAAPQLAIATSATAARAIAMAAKPILDLSQLVDLETGEVLFQFLGTGEVSLPAASWALVTDEGTWWPARRTMSRTRQPARSRRPRLVVAGSHRSVSP